MAEIKEMNSHISVSDMSFGTSVMDRVMERERKRGRAQAAAAAFRRNITAIVAMAVVFVILMQSIAIYAMQSRISTVQGEITSLQRTNEALRVSILKAGNLEKSKSDAGAAQFVSRAGKDGLRVDLQYDNFTGKAAETVTGTPNLIDRICSVFK